jgi:hypothetical protein
MFLHHCAIAELAQELNKPQSFYSTFSTHCIATRQRRSWRCSGRVFSAWIGTVARFPVPKIHDHNETQRNKMKRMHACKKPSVACPPPAFTLIELLVERLKLEKAENIRHCWSHYFEKHGSTK